MSGFSARFVGNAYFSCGNCRKRGVIAWNPPETRRYHVKSAGKAALLREIRVGAAERLLRGRLANRTEEAN